MCSLCARHKLVKRKNGWMQSTEITSVFKAQKHKIVFPQRRTTQSETIRVRTLLYKSNANVSLAPKTHKYYGMFDHQSKQSPMKYENLYTSMWCLRHLFSHNFNAKWFMQKVNGWNCACDVYYSWIAFGLCVLGVCVLLICIEVVISIICMLRERDRESDEKRKT